MLNVVETFSGIGSQAKALDNIGIEYKIDYTADWDINAIIAYDLIHNGKQDLTKYQYYSKEYLLDVLEKYTLSLNGKKEATKEEISKLDENTLKRVLAAIERTNNLVSVTSIKGKDLPNKIDLLTYSFPCQDLSLAGSWQGNKGGIDRNAHNRSSMLWEIERILKERVTENLNLPKFLLMENVSQILSEKHIKNFNEWTNYLESIGYYNKIYTLNSGDFGIPQKRIRTYMLSILIGVGEIKKRFDLDKYFENNNLENKQYVNTLAINNIQLKDILKIDYKNKVYRVEANKSQPNDTISRREIYEKNEKLLENGKPRNIKVPTVTTKQDRHPNSGVIDYLNGKEGKSSFRYLTPRECFLLMGFEEKDYENIINNNFISKGRSFFNIEKLNKMAGNSIVVNVLEKIFEQMEYIRTNIIVEENNEKMKSSILQKMIDINKKKYESFQLIK